MNFDNRSAVNTIECKYVFFNFKNINIISNNYLQSIVFKIFDEQYLSYFK